MKVKDLDQQFLFFAGIRLQGFADGDAMTIAYSKPAFSYKKGADGLGTRSKNLDRSALATLRLSASSSVNDVLSAIHNGDYKSTNGAGVSGFSYKDGQGTTNLSGKDAYIESPPDPSIAAETGVYEWKIRIDDLSGTWGGN